MAARRVPPHDLDAERAVIGAMLVSETAASVVGERLAENDFYSENHRIIFEAIREMQQNGTPVDRVTLIEALKKREEFERIGGPGYVFQIVEAVPTAANADRYAQIVSDKATLRRMLDAAARIGQMAYDEPEAVSEALDAAEQLVYEVSDTTGAPQELSSLGELVPHTMERVQMLYEQGGEVTGVPSGFADLDEMTTGYHEGDLVILAARPAMGKTALALGIAWHNAAKLGTAVAVFSLEMSKEQLVQRLYAQESHIPTAAIRTGKLADDQWPRFVRASASMGCVPLYIDDTGSMTVGAMRSRLRRLSSRLRARDQRLGLVVVDYLQLMTSAKSRDSRVQEISEISRGLKVLARDLNVPVLALSQLSRAVEQRGNKRPMLSDLRESGAIEQDADLVKFLYRDEYYNEDSDDRGVAEVIVGKHRQGPTGTVKLAWIDREARFGSLARRNGRPEPAPRDIDEWEEIEV